MTTSASPERVRSEIRDLGGYPRWAGLVRSATPSSTDDGSDAWQVELGARLGPWRRSKRLRMVRTLDDDRAVRFERCELDGRPHSPWIMSARIDDTADRTRLKMTLEYGGTLWVPLLDRLMNEAVSSSRRRLLKVLDAESGDGA